MMKYSLALLAAIAAVEASPFPQAVTASLAPTASPPPGCTESYSGKFGILNMNVTSPSTAPAKRQASQISDGQPQVASTVSGAVTQISDAQPQAATTVATVSGAVSQISDAQPQAATTAVVVTGARVSMITDGQVQGGMHTVTMMPVTQIGDGQVQGGTVTMMPVTVISDGQPQAPGPIPTATPVSQISDAQPQAPTATAVSQISDAQPQAPTATAVSQISDAQPQAPSATTGVSQISDAQPQATTSAAVSGSTALAFCEEPDSLELTLSDGILKDGKGRTGYIASNFQFQFDDPPQAGAIYTAGFSVCGNGTLSLGGSSIFYQCRSGAFYNLYDRKWAAQCNAIYIQTGMFVNCPSS